MSSRQSALKIRSNRRNVIVGVVLVQIIVAGFLLVSRMNGGSEPDSQELTSAQEALRIGADAQTNGNAAVAEDAYLRALELDPRNKIAYYNLGVLEEDKATGNRAEEFYQKALGIDPNFVPALFNMAVLRDTAGRPQEAANLYRKVIELEPAMGEAHLNLGFLLVRELGQREEGRKELLKAIVLDESLAKRVPKEDLEP